MDGNGRWAQARGLERIEGHKAGLDSVKRAIQACLEQGVQILSLFAFSSENWNRPQQEVQFLMSLFVQALDKEMEQLHQRGIQLQFCGDLTQLSTQLRQKINHCQQLTVENRQLTLNIVVNYGGKWDIVQASKQIATAVKANKLAIDDIDEALFSQYLNTYPLCEPDLLIRTSGEQRISNFYLWQLAYCELYFCDVLWPDFTASHLEQALLHYANRERRFGALPQTKESHA